MDVKGTYLTFRTLQMPLDPDSDEFAETVRREMATAVKRIRARFIASQLAREQSEAPAEADPQHESSEELTG